MARFTVPTPARTRKHTDPRQGLPAWTVGTLSDLERLLEVPHNRLNNAARRGAIWPAYEIAGHRYFRLVDAVEYITRNESRGYAYAKLSNVTRQSRDAQAPQSA